MLYTKKEIPTAETNRLIVDLALTNGSLVLAINLGLGTKRHISHMEDLMKELLKRGVITEEDIETLNR